jgi:ribosome-associated protein
MPINAEGPTFLATESGKGSVQAETQALTQLVTDALEDRKAQAITVLDVHELTDVTDMMVVACGRSTRQVRATAEHVIERSKKAGCRPLGVEGLRDGEWVLVDLCDVVLHVMTPETRETYQLEKLWGGAGRRQPSQNTGSA